MQLTIAELRGDKYTVNYPTCAGKFGPSNSSAAGICFPVSRASPAVRGRASSAHPASSPQARRAGRSAAKRLDAGEHEARLAVKPASRAFTRGYHVHYKPLYRAIGEENNRHRRPAALPRALERMMLLDAVLAHRDGIWLATEEEKVRHFLLSHRIPREDLPSLTFRAASGETARFFPDKLPINIDRDGYKYTFLYLVTQDLPIDFRRFLERHAELLRALPAWVIRLLVPVHMTHAMPLYQSAFHEHLTTPLRHAVMEELKWYFRARRSQSSDDQQRFDEAAEAFGAPRFQMLYREWLDRGESVLEGTVSTALPDAIARGNGRLECHVSPHKYLHLASLVGTA
jgi:hypothetical protein